MLRILLNILWIVFGGGFIIWLEYVVVGLLLCATVIGLVSEIRPLKSDSPYYGYDEALV